MALSYQNYTGDSVTTTFSIPFTYTDTSEISVTVDGVAQTGLTFPSASSVQLTSAPATSTLVQVKRTTDLTARAVDYVSGSVLTEEDLDNANIQVFHAVQESVDATGDTIALATDDKWDAQNKVIKNLANPVADTDAVNKQFISANLPNINTVAGIASDVTTVAGISSNVTTVAGNNTNVTTVGSNIASVNTVATNIADVITVANDLNEAISEIETAALDLQEATSEIDVVANSIANVDTVGAAIANVNLTAASITDVNTVAADITNVNTVAGSVTNVNTVAGDITNVNNVAGNATNINTVAGNNANVTTVATDIANVNTVATSIANVNSVGTNIASVINASNSISSINNFGDTYFVSATAPSSPTLGDLWFDTSSNVMKVYTATGFANAGSSVNGTSERQTYTATGGQTNFAATYDAGYVDVYLNGVKLISGTDFTATDGATIVLASGATAGDTVDIVAFGTFDVIDVGGSLTTLGIDNHNLVTVDGSGNVDVTGSVTSDGLTVDGNLSVDGGTIKLDGNYPVGTGNVALGNTALDSNVSGGSNTAIGADALTANTASYNTAVGHQAAYSNTTASFNAAFGFQSLRDNTTGADNTAIGGYQTLIQNTTGSYNTAVGRAALQANTTASNNTAVGYQAAYSNSTGSAITAIGQNALASSTTASNNVAVGQDSLYSLTTGTGNVVAGTAAARGMTTGNYNTVMGQEALKSNTTASYSVAVGTEAGVNSTGGSNTFIGWKAGVLTTSGGENTFLGRVAGSEITTGAKNTIVGSYNGNQGGLDIRTSSNNIVLSDGDGHPFLWGQGNNTLSINAISVNPTLVWRSAGTIKWYQFSQDGDSDNLRITSNFSTGVKLTTSATSWSSYSDERLKDIIEPIENAVEKVSSLRSVIGKYKTDEENTRRAFLIAQDLQDSLPEAVDDPDQDGMLSARYTDVIPFLVAAIKELSAKNDALEARIAQLEAN